MRCHWAHHIAELLRLLCEHGVCSHNIGWRSDGGFGVAVVGCKRIIVDLAVAEYGRRRAARRGAGVSFALFALLFGFEALADAADVAHQPGTLLRQGLRLTDVVIG